MTAAVNPDEAAPKRMAPKKLRFTLYWLALDWINLRETQPSPMKAGGPQRQSNVRDYGHPSEWASDTARDIVDKLSGWHDYLAEARKERRPVTGALFGTTVFRAHIDTVLSEKRRLVAAWKYLEPRCEQLVELVEAEALKELPDLHHKIRRALGQYAPKYTLPVPCPSDECGLRTLIRVQGVGQDFISCDACGYTIKELHYPLLIRMTLDAFLASAA